MRATFLVFFLLLPVALVHAQKFTNPDTLAPDFPTPQIVVDRMLALAEIKPTEKFANEKNVGAIDDLGAKRTVDGEFFECERRAEIGESTERGAELKQASLRTPVGRKGIELIATNGTEQNSIAGQRLVERIGRQRSAIVHNGDTTNTTFRKANLMAAEHGCFFQHRNSFVGDFGADVVACDYMYLQLHPISQRCDQF